MNSGFSNHSLPSGFPPRDIENIKLILVTRSMLFLMPPSNETDSRRTAFEDRGNAGNADSI